MIRASAKAGEGFVVFGGRVRKTRVYGTLTEAEQARGGTPCWISTGRHVPGKNGGEYETVVTPAVRREERSGRVYFTWRDEIGECHGDQGYRSESFETFAAAKAVLVKRAERHVKDAMVRLEAQRAELRKTRAIKPLKPGKAVVK